METCSPPPEQRELNFYRKFFGKKLDYDIICIVKGVRVMNGVNYRGWGEILRYLKLSKNIRFFSTGNKETSNILYKGLV